MITKTGKVFYPRIAGGAPEGLVGDLTLAIERPDNTVVQAASASGIVETSDGAYTGTRTAPTEAGTYIIVWYDPNSDVSVTQELVVTTSTLSDDGLYYATPDDFRAYLGVDDIELSDDQLLRPMLGSQRDLDAACGSWAVFIDTGLKFASEDASYLPVLSDLQDDLLRRAMCYQTEYRMTMGDDFMVKEQYEAQSGPGYSTSGKLRKVCGAAYSELSKAGLLRLHGKMSNRNPLRYGELPRIN